MKKRFKIYHSFTHILGTFLVLLIPFLFLLLFSNFAHIATGKLFADIGYSFYRMLIAYTIGASLAWLTAVTFYRGKVSTIALPIFDVLQSAPTFAALPLIVYFFGASNTVVIIFLAAEIIWPVFFSVVTSLRQIKSDWQEVAQVTHLTGLNYLRKFLWPISVPGLITGSIIGLGDAWQALVATEILVGIKSGLGNFFKSFSTNTSITVFGILGFLLLIFVINKLIWLPLLDFSHKLMEE